MPLYRKHRFQRPGWAEVGAVAVVLAALGASLAWIDAATGSALASTSGRVVACEIRLTHYNAVDTPPKVFMDYAYTAGSGAYTGHWEGFWPASKSPDALPPEKLDLLKSPGRTVTVFYDPANPRDSFLHGPAKRLPAVYAFLAATMTLVAVVYVGGIYPAWKKRR